MAKKPVPRDDDAGQLPELPPAEPKADKVQEPPPDAFVMHNIGPIEHAVIRAPAGHVTVLKGRNGAGKTEALKSIQALGGADVRLTKLDDTAGGYVSGFGITLKVTASGQNRRSGELTVDSIDGEVSLKKIIDPGIDDVVAADAARMKEILTLLKLELGPENVYPLLGGPQMWNRYCEHVEYGGKVTAVEFIARVKSALQSAARTEEKDADRLTGEKDALKLQLDRIPIAMVSAAEAQKRQAEAIAAKARLDERAEQAKAQAESRAAAAKSSGPVRPISGYEADMQDAINARTAAQAEVDRLEDLLLEARNALVAAKTAVTTAETALNDARTADEEITRLRESLAAATIVAPTADELAAAQKEIDEANASAAAAARTTERQLVAGQYDGKNKLATEAADRANRLRAAAEKLPSLISDAIKKAKVPALTVNKEMRLLVTGHSRGNVYVSELSHGERAALALRLVACACAANGSEPLVGLEQEAWEALDGAARDEVRSNVAALKIRLVTAEADRQNPPSEEMVVETLPQL